MSNITYKDLILDRTQIKELYLDAGWFAYTNDCEKLYKGILNSTDCIGAYDKDLLVGLIRTISDGETICHIQDILVLKKYQRRGIGKQLMSLIFDKYPHIRQILLMTEDTSETRLFYESMGMESYDKVKGLGFKLKK